jgi:hypothetical protein
VANACASSGKSAKSRRLAELDAHDREEILLFAVTELARRDRLKDAVREADAIGRAAYRAAAYSEIALGVVRAGQKDRAAEYLRRAIESRQRSDASSDTMWALVRAAEALLPRRRALADAFLDAAIHAVPLLSNEYDHSDAVKDVVVCCCRTGRTDEGERLLDSIPNDIRRAESAKEVALVIKAGTGDGVVEEGIRIVGWVRPDWRIGITDGAS